MTDNGPSYNTPKENFRAIRIFYIALVIGVVLFLLMALFIHNLNGPLYKEMIEYYKVLISIAVALALLCLFFASQGFKKGILGAKNVAGPLNNKLNYYRNLLIRYMALCELPAIFSVIIFLVTGEFWMLTITFVMLAAMLSVAPTPKRVITDLNLDWKEQKEIE